MTFRQRTVNALFDFTVSRFWAHLLDNGNIALVPGELRFGARPAALVRERVRSAQIIEDSNLILILMDDVARKTRSRFPGCLLDNVEVDYGVEAVAGGRPVEHARAHDGSQRNELLKIEDREEPSVFDIVDRCEALKDQVDQSPKVFAMGSSVVEETLHSYESNYDLEVSHGGSCPHCTLEFLEGIDKTAEATPGDLSSGLMDPFRQPLSSLRRSCIRSFWDVEQLDVLSPPLFDVTAHTTASPPGSPPSRTPPALPKGVDEQTFAAQAMQFPGWGLTSFPSVELSFDPIFDGVGPGDAAAQIECIIDDLVYEGARRDLDTGAFVTLFPRRASRSVIDAALKPQLIKVNFENAPNDQND
ncbi:uncharacterized protein BXZ73DRAFT_99072 [Epithele typhae]|uniref:uncharacterized protein n=1 Tax=Epithele typhae TaxID=378194 RepID=UPI002008CE99|nr:uncharacterized protein BXZ73DRAFT_99072 [Epithele typhae]KAH9940071.1 hypothetical protein BXZ73DRAFT_99072 [Epithele typhae]